MVDVAEVKSLFEKLESKMVKSVDFFKEELGTVRAGRANPQILNKVMVNYYGTMTPISQMANISVPEARLLTISVWDQSALKDVTKAILASDIGITPSDDGKVIRLVFPQLTEERRRELVKQIKKSTEDAKVTIRNERRDAIEVLKRYKKDNILTEDDLADCEKDAQKLTDKFILEIERLFAEKEKEILEV